MQDETACLDHDQLGSLYAQLGAVGAEDVVRRTMEELALRLTHAERQYRSCEFDALRKSAASLIAIAEQIGMQKVSMVAEDVAISVDQGDEVALAATLSRLLRVGEGSLTAMWDLQDFTV